jgi:hypothetical protein
VSSKQTMRISFNSRPCKFTFCLIRVSTEALPVPAVSFIFLFFQLAHVKVTLATCLT